MDTNKLKAQLAAMQEEINRTAEQYGLGGHLQHMMNGGEIHQLPVAPYGYAASGTKNDGKKYHAFNSQNYHRPAAQSNSAPMHTQNRPGTPIVNPMLQHQVSDIYNLMQFGPDKEIQGTNITYTPEQIEALRTKNLPDHVISATNNYSKSASGKLPTGNFNFTTEADLVRQMNSNTIAPKNTKLTQPTSIVDAMKLMGDDSSFVNRKKMAEKMGIKNYTGTGDQNKELLQKYYASKRQTTNNTTNEDLRTLSQQPTIEPLASRAPAYNRPVPAYPVVNGNTIIEQPYSFDELPNTGAIMMNDRATGSAMPSSQVLQPVQNMDMGEYNQQYGPYKMGGVAGQMGDMYYAGGNIPSHPEIMHLYGFEEGGQIMELPVAPYGYNEDGGKNEQLPVDIAVARFKAAAKDKGLSGGEAMAYVEKMKSKYNYQAGGAVKESDISQYDLAQYGNGGIMFDGNRFPGYNKAIATPPGDKHKKMMILKKGGKVKLVKFGHR